MDINDDAWISKRRNDPMQTVASRPGFVAEVHPLMLCRDPLYEAPHALLGRVDLATPSEVGALAK